MSFYTNLSYDVSNVSRIDIYFKQEKVKKYEFDNVIYHFAYMIMRKKIKVQCTICLHDYQNVCMKVTLSCFSFYSSKHINIFILISIFTFISLISFVLITFNILILELCKQYSMYSQINKVFLNLIIVDLTVCFAQSSSSQSLCPVYLYLLLALNVFCLQFVYGTKFYNNLSHAHTCINLQVTSSECF